MYGVMHTEKYGRAAVYGMQIEDRRTIADEGKFERSAIHWEKTKDNYHLVDTEKWNKSITAKLREAKVKERKDSKVLIGTVYSASPDFFEGISQEKMKQYFQDCFDFHVKEYCQGDESRVISAVVHLDETTPHMQIQSIPLYKDENNKFHLSAKIVVGNRIKMREMQDKFYNEVCKSRNLERGELVDWTVDPKERRSHKDKTEYWKGLEKELSLKVEGLTKKAEELERDIEKKDTYIKKIEDRILHSDSESRNLMRKYKAALEDYNALLSQYNNLNEECENLLNSPKFTEFAADIFIRKKGLFKEFEDYKRQLVWKHKPQKIKSFKKEFKDFDR